MWAHTDHIGGTSVGDQRTLVMPSAAERDCLVRVLERVLEDPRSLRKSRTGFLSMVSRCLPACGSANAPSSPRGRRSKASVSTLSSISGGQTPANAKIGSAFDRKQLNSSHIEQLPGMGEAREEVKKQWDKLVMMTTRTSSTSIGLLKGVAGAVYRSKDEGLKSSPTLPLQGQGDYLDVEQAGLLLDRILSSGQNESSDYTPLIGLHTSVAFQEFWDICVPMLLVEQIWEGAWLTDTKERNSWQQRVKDLYGDQKPVARWQYFLLQVQMEDDAKTIEAGQDEVDAMKEVDRSSVGGITLVGLSRYLCTEANSILPPKRCKQHQDMSLPLTDYWIGAAHHVYGDPPPSGVMPTFSIWSGGQSQPYDPGLLTGLHAALRAGCRCISLALVAGDNDGISVLMQQQRAPFTDALKMVGSLGFAQKPSFPIVLVLTLSLLPASACEVVPALLETHLGDRLWRSSILPSPQEAKDRVIVAVAPKCKPDDSLLISGEPLELPSRAPVLAVGGQQAVLDAKKMLGLWEELAGSVVVWPGVPFDVHLPNRSPLEMYIAHVPADYFGHAEDSEQRKLVEYHRQHLSLAYPVATRSAPANFNPSGPWTAGVQMSALTFGLGGIEGISNDSMCLAHAGRFAEDNGGCGYILKP